MTIDPTREEWLAARERVLALWPGNVPGDPHWDTVVEAALGPCPPEPAPEPWQLAGMGSLAVGVAVPSTDARIVFRNQAIAQLNPDEAEAMACSLVEHARYAREQEGDDPWRSDEEAEALIAAIKEPRRPPTAAEAEVCGALLAGRPGDTWDNRCQRPKGHSIPCASEDDE